MGRRQKLIAASFFAAGLGLFIIAFSVGNSGTDDVSVSRNPAIDQLIPNRGDNALQQANVGIDLAAGYQLVSLAISPDARCEFPVDVTAHTRHVEGLQRYIYSPGEGLPVAALSGDFNCAVAVFEEIARPGDTERIEWEFTVN